MAINRWYRGYASDVTDVLMHMDVLSQGFDMMQRCENDGFSDRVVAFASLGRNQWGSIDRVTVNGTTYRFAVNDQRRVTGLLATLATGRGRWAGSMRAPARSPSDSPRRATRTSTLTSMRST